MAYTRSELLQYGAMVEVIARMRERNDPGNEEEVHERVLELMRVSRRYADAWQELAEVAWEVSGNRGGDAAKRRVDQLNAKLRRLRGLWEAGCMALEVDSATNGNDLGLRALNTEGAPYGPRYIF